jgi:hypothetical protein
MTIMRIQGLKVQEIISFVQIPKTPLNMQNSIHFKFKNPLITLS